VTVKALSIQFALLLQTNLDTKADFPGPAKYITTTNEYIILSVAQIYLLIQKEYIRIFVNDLLREKGGKAIIVSIAGAPVNIRNILPVEKILKINIYSNGNPAKPERFMECQIKLIIPGRSGSANFASRWI